MDDSKMSEFKTDHDVDHLDIESLEAELSQVPNFQYHHQHLMSSGQPSAEHIAKIKAYGDNFEP